MDMSRLFVGTVAALLVTGCATTGPVPGRTDIGDAIRTRTGRELRVEPGAQALPPGVSLAALTREDAVAVALWNSPSFEASLTELGLARADLVEARLLRNPIFSLLFPWGPKQLEWTLQFPVDALWQRPRRVAAQPAIGGGAPRLRRADARRGCPPRVRGSGGG